ncbi:MAG: DUF4242 domain-containing protein [Planctomycetota bacterium]|jgi:hypothetical protein
MPRYVVERTIPGIGSMLEAELAEAVARSGRVTQEIDGLHWVHTYVTGDKTYCVYDAKDEAQLREHSEKSGFPADSIAKISHAIDPSWEERAGERLSL